MDYPIPAVVAESDMIPTPPKSDEAATETSDSRCPITAQEKELAFVAYANRVAADINAKNVETNAGFAACHGYKPKTQYNKDKSDE